MFEPLRETIELLHNYEQELQEDSLKQLEELPEKWEATKKRVSGLASRLWIKLKKSKISFQASAVRLSVSPLQANEVLVIRKKCSAFDVKQHEFRERFRR